MRLTLRTLLAYLDDTLEPAEAKQIGQKVAESDTAQELIARIKQVTRRRRLTTPPDAGPNKLDANTIADYLDNTLDADQLAEVEQICLASDVHLAEMASCHQILTLVLGEPALVPPTAKKRMYALTKGRESIQSRKPPAVAPADVDELQPEAKEVDETLRLGLPALRRKGGWQNAAIIFGGAFGLVACLVIVVLALLGPLGRTEDEEPRPRGKDGPRVAQGDGNKGKDEQPDGKKGQQDGPDGQPDGKKGGKNPKENGGQDGKPEDKKQGDGGKPDDGKKDDGKTDDGKGGNKEQPVEDVEHGPPSDKVVPIGNFEPPPQPATTVLFQFDPEKLDWQRVERDPRKKAMRVSTGQPLMSLPGFHSVIQTDSGVRLVLAGALPEQLGGLPLFESRVQLHQHDKLDLDLTLERGRIALTNTKEKPLRVRVRFANPTDPKLAEMWDITLQGKDSEALIDLFGMFPFDEPFYEKPDHTDRIGPIAQFGLTMLNGEASVRVNDTTHSLGGPPGPARLVWNSEKGLAGPIEVKKLEGWARLNPVPPKVGPKGSDGGRADLIRALPLISQQLLGRPVLQGLNKLLESAEPPERKLALRSMAAVDLISPLVDALDDKRADVRRGAVEALEHFVASARDNDYKVFAQLKERYSEVEAPKIVSMLHGPPGRMRERPETYDILLDHILRSKLALRELATWHLTLLWPEAAAKIAVDPAASAEARKRSYDAWRKLIPRGKVPPHWDKSGAGGT
jgi:hypothetical protein